MKKDFVELVDLYYTIDYLKLEMAKNFDDKFVFYWNRHIEDYNRKGREEKLEDIDTGVRPLIGKTYADDSDHFEKCPAVARMKSA